MRRDGQGQGIRISIADVLGGENDQSPRDVERILPGLEQTREIVERGIGIARAQALDERGYDVEMLFPISIMA